MMPGVTYFPAPSMNTASAGAITVGPTATILRSWRRIAPFRISGPAAVKMFTLRITVGRDANGAYVLGKGSALGTLSAPAPGGGPGFFAVSAAGLGACAGAVGGCWAAAAPPARARSQGVGLARIGGGWPEDV